MADEAKSRFYFPGYFTVNGFNIDYNAVDALRRATALYDAWNQRGEVARLRAIVSAFEGAINELHAKSSDGSPERAEIKALQDAIFERVEHAITKEDGERAWDAEQAAKWPGVLKPATTPAASDDVTAPRGRRWGMSDERPIEQREMMARILADDAISALWKACEKHPPIHSSHEGYGVLCEEARELSDALNYQGPLMREIQAANRDAIRKELVHVMAMCLRFGIELDSMRVA